MIYKYFIGVAIYFAVIPQIVRLIDTSPVNEVDNEPDDVKLNEALVLVDILKSEYVKLLKQNLELRNGEPNDVDDDINQSTCATTAAGGAGNSTLNETNGSRLKLTSKSLTESSPASAAPSPESTPAASSLAAPWPLTTQWTLADRLPWPATERRLALAGPSMQHGAWQNMSVPAAVMAYYDLPLPSHLPFPAYHKPYQVPQSYFRRRIPDYYYYDFIRRRYEPSMGDQNERRNIEANYRRAFQQGTDTRRFIYNAHPYKQLSSIEASTATKSTTAEAVISAVSKSTSTSTDSSSTTKTSTRRRKGSSLDVILVRSTLARLAEQKPITTKSYLFSTPVVTSKTIAASQASRRLSFRTTSTLHQRHRTKDLKLKQGKSISRTKDPVASQVISELLKEMEREGVYLQNHTSESPSRLSQEISRRNNNNRADWPAFAFKTSMKVYLEGSTRYPIPLPENHAFCYTNPNNRLCRTMIK